ncbi:Insertion element protein [Actinomycetospora rhizophila]|uniref:Insertion element protein n=1 Tax=Actinomycetospora rhizophila TaxID=1416876 RepID=A0ABV9ZM93_9PSEU
MRLAVQYCPYCGEQDLRPREEPAGAWECADCRSTFVITPVHQEARR